MPVLGTQNERVFGEGAGGHESRSRGSRLAQVFELAEEKVKSRRKLQALQLESYRKDKKLATDAGLVGTKLNKLV